MVHVVLYGYSFSIAAKLSHFINLYIFFFFFFFFFFFCTQWIDKI